MTILELHPEKIRVGSGGCWIWTGAMDARGYGMVRTRGRTWRAHRFAFLLAEGYIPPRPSYHHPQHGKALVLDHRCKNSSCVNPDHLEVVTNGENIRRGDAGKRERERTHCPSGHPYDEANTYVYPDGRRECRTCNREANRRYREKERGGQMERTGFGKWLDKTMTEQGVGPAELADSVGVARTQVWSWRKGNSEPTAANLLRVAEFFGTPIEEMLRYG